MAKQVMTKDWRRYCADSPQRVISHALWAASRGRNPSMPYRGIVNPRAALALANAEMDALWRHDCAIAAEIEERLAKAPKNWRCDRRSNEEPTVSFLVICAEDRAGHIPGEIFSLHIHHVKSYRGKGFRALVACGGSSVGTDVALGEGPDTYEKVLAAGRKLLQAEVETLRRDMENDHARIRWFQRGRRGNPPCKPRQR